MYCTEYKREKVFILNSNCCHCINIVNRVSSCNFLEAVRIEMLTPSRVVLGTNIVVAGAVAHYGDFILRKHSSILKRTIITCCLFWVMGVFLFGVISEWIYVIHL